jgi:hypothetical protein
MPTRNGDESECGPSNNALKLAALGENGAPQLSAVLGRPGGVMWPFGRRTPEETFWRWFQQNSDRLFRFEADQDRVFGELSSALSRVEKGLVFEFGKVREGRREFAVSADGITARFPAVRRLVAVAPSLPQWVIIPFRPPASLEVVIEYAGISLGPDDIWFVASQRSKVHLTLFVRGLTEANLPTLRSAGFVLLDNALGEFAVATQVGFVEWKPLPEDPAVEGLKPLRSIRDAFDAVSH